MSEKKRTRTKSRRRSTSRKNVSKPQGNLGKFYMSLKGTKIPSWLSVSDLKKLAIISGVSIAGLHSKKMIWKALQNAFKMIPVTDRILNQQKIDESKREEVKQLMLPEKQKSILLNLVRGKRVPLLSLLLLSFLYNKITWFQVKSLIQRLKDNPTSQKVNEAVVYLKKQLMSLFGGSASSSTTVTPSRSITTPDENMEEDETERQRQEELKKAASNEMATLTTKNMIQSALKRQRQEAETERQRREDEAERMRIEKEAEKKIQEEVNASTAEDTEEEEQKRQRLKADEKTLDSKPSSSSSSSSSSPSSRPLSKSTKRTLQRAVEDITKKEAAEAKSKKQKELKRQEKLAESKRLAKETARQIPENTLQVVEERIQEPTPNWERMGIRESEYQRSIKRAAAKAEKAAAEEYAAEEAAAKTEAETERQRQKAASSLRRQISTNTLKKQKASEKQAIEEANRLRIEAEEKSILRTYLERALSMFQKIE